MPVGTKSSPEQDEAGSSGASLNRVRVIGKQRNPRCTGVSITLVHRQEQRKLARLRRKASRLSSEELKNIMVIKGLAEVMPPAGMATSASSGHSGEPVGPMKEVGTSELGIDKKPC